MKFDLEKLIEKFTCGDDNQAEESAKILSNLGKSIIPELMDLLESNVEDKRWWAVRTISSMEDPPADIFDNMLSDESIEVRKCAALSISHHPTANAIEKLIELIADKDPLMSNLAANALIAIGNKSIMSLLENISSLEGLGRIEAYRAIANIVDKNAITILMDGLEDDSYLVNYWAEEGLTKLGLDMVYIKPK